MLHSDARNAVNEAALAMSEAKTEFDKLRAVEACARQLSPSTDSDEIDRLSELAINTHALKTNIVQTVIARGMDEKATMSVANGVDLSAAAKSQEKPKPRFALVPFSQLRVSADPDYLIHGLVPGVGLCLVYGPPKCGKSFWITDAMLHVALGWKYRGRKVKQGTVVYCAFEGQDGYGRRAEAFRAKHLQEEGDPVPFFLMPTRMDLVKEGAALIQAIELQFGDNKPVAIVLDTLNRSIGGSESDDKDMSAYIRAADALREKFGCAVIIVHHSGLAEGRPRGHTSLTGAADAQLEVKRDAAGHVITTVEWMKDGPEGEVIISRLVPVPVGTNREGDEITSCLVEAVADAEAKKATLSGRLSDKQRLALKALTNCAAESGTPPPASFGLPNGLIAVKLGQWRDQMLRCGPLDRDAKNPRTDFARLKDALASRHLIGERDGLVWRAAT